MHETEERFGQGWEFHQAGDRDRAEAVYRGILKANPDDGRVWFVLGTLCQEENRAEEAIACFQQAIRLVPHEAEGPFRLGNVYLEQGRLQEAAAAYQQCLHLLPEHVEALTNLGFILGEQGNLDAALANYQRAVGLRPDYAELHQNIGNVLREQGRLEEALACYREALRLKPDYLKAQVNQAIAQVMQGHPEEGERSLRRALEMEPEQAEIYNGVGAATSMQGKLAEAATHYRRALTIRPDYAEAHWNLALVLLLDGHLAEGWDEYEWRWRCKQTTPLPVFRQPRWDGEPLNGRTILLHSEQGLGDTFHFIRYAPLVKRLGGTVLVQCQPVASGLVKTCRGIDWLAAGDAPREGFDVWAPFLSLPRYLGRTLADIPAEVPYLFADPELVLRWRQTLAHLGGLRVGIAWQGNPKHPWDRHRSIPLACFEPLARISGVTLISLQKGPGTDQLATATGRLGVLALGEELDGGRGPFQDSAAILRNLDLLISSDTAMAHLAGALGVPVWLALCTTPDWRWLLHRTDSPWYPTMRLFRQKNLGDWQPVFEEMAAELREARVR
jgi:tetratricopeptide (TPR) repeat protein